MDFICPNCKSENIQRLSAVFHHGYADINATGTGVGYGVNSGAVVSTTQINGSSQTIAAQRAAPPYKKKWYDSVVKYTFWYLVCMFITYGMFITSKDDITSPLCRGFTIVWIVMSIVKIVTSIRYNRNKYPPLIDSWNNSYLCYRCNDIFELRP